MAFGRVLMSVSTLILIFLLFSQENLFNRECGLSTSGYSKRKRWEIEGNLYRKRDLRFCHSSASEIETGGEINATVCYIRRDNAAVKTPGA